MATKSDVFIKLSLVFVISLLSFAIGTFVGKKYSDNQHTLSSMEPGDHKREVASDHHEDKSHTEKKDQMTDQEIAKLAEEFIADDEGHGKDDGHGNVAQVESHSEKADHGDEGHGEVAKDTHGTTAKAEKKSEDSHSAPAKSEKISDSKPLAPAHDLIAKKGQVEEPTPTHNETRVPSSIPKDVAQYSVGKFTVQVAAFSTEGDAKKKASDLKEKGFSAFYIPANVNGQTWYRVSIGLFATEKEAKEYRSEFLGKSKTESAIIQKIAN